MLIKLLIRTHVHNCENTLLAGNLNSKEAKSYLITFHFQQDLYNLYESGRYFIKNPTKQTSPKLFPKIQNVNVF